MANTYSTQDAIKGALQRTGENTDGTSAFHGLALKYVNQVHKDIIKGNSVFAPDMREPWSWARKTGNGILLAYQKVTASVTQGSASGTFSAAPTISLQGYFFTANPAGTSQGTFYKIAQHTALSTSFTLDGPYIEPTNAALSVSAIPLISDLGPGIQRLVEPLRIYLQRVLEFGETAQDMGRVYGMDPLEFWKEYPLQLIINDVPSKFVTIFRSESSWQIQFNKYIGTGSAPQNNLRFDYDFIPIPQDLVDASDSIPLIPRDDRDVLETGAAYYLYLDKKQKEDAANYFAMTQSKLTALKEADRANAKFYGDIYGQLIPRRDDTAIPYWVIQK